MQRKPRSADGYGVDQTEAARSVCLTLAVRLREFADDLVVVGGLAPSLLVENRDTSSERLFEPHVGTLDLDVGISLTVLESERYRDIVETLRANGFVPDTNENGNPRSQRWVSPDGTSVDFLISPLSASDKAGGIRNLAHQFAAVITPGLDLAFKDCEVIEIDGALRHGAKAARPVKICGPAAFVVLKALAYRNRSEPKDAYDLWYVLQNYGDDIEEIISRFKPLLAHDTAKQAVDALRIDFMEEDRVGPVDVAIFLIGQPDESIQADVVGTVRRFLDGLEVSPGQ